MINSLSDNHAYLQTLYLGLRAVIRAKSVMVSDENVNGTQAGRVRINHRRLETSQTLVLNSQHQRSL